ncbi:MAG: beta strand repeat-containing protein [Desulfovibrio sp.]
MFTISGNNIVLTDAGVAFYQTNEPGDEATGMTVTFTDAAGNTSDPVAVAINAQDIDEVAPVASVTPQNFDEDSAAGTTVATISYTDTDNENTTAGSTPTLNNVPQHGGADMFTISGNNIVLTDAGVAFYQTNEPGDEATGMTVTFTDAAGNTSDPVAVAINAQDIDEVAPVASATPQNFDEDSAAGTTVATISYTDTDNENTTAGSTPTLNNVPQHGGADMFTISGNNIVLTEAGVAFYQTNEPGDEATSMTVTFTDAAGNTSDPVAVAINAQDIDEVAPVASVTPQNFDEDSAAGTTVATISYTDTDNENTTAGSTPTLNNVPQHGGADMFTISGNNIVLTDAGVAFYQTNEPGDEATGMTVTFTDAAGNTSDPVAVAINAQDIDEVAPVASVTPQNFDEDSAAGTTVATISYTDTDNENTAVGSTPTLNNVPQHGGADMFTISGNNIVLTEAGVAFYQTNEPGDEATGMTVTFTDAAGNTSDPVAVAINAQDIDEVAPVASVTPQNFDEDSAAGTTVATISYTDTDNENTAVGSTPTLNNVPQHGGADMFTISGNNIVLTDAGVAFYQTNEPGDEATGMTVTFTDAAGNTSDPVAVAINAQDIDEVAPVASVTPQNFDEDSAAGTTVATISYTDTDNENTAVGSTPTLNNVPQHGGADMFTISGNNIVLTEAGVAFYQTNEPGDEATGMTVTFTDAAGNTSDPVAVAINAQDIDEVAPVASVTPQNFDEDSAAGTTVATISYTDTDNENTTAGSTPTLNNVPQHGGADMFTISGNNIVLTEAGVAFYQTNEPGDEATGMTVTFTDAAGNTSDPVAVAINAQDIDEVAPVASVTPQNFDEDSAAGTTVATISYTDTDNENTTAGSTPTLNNVPQHGGADMFTISGNNIVLTDAGVAFYQTNEPGDEATGMTVTFTDAAGNTSDPVAVAINAQDIDEVAPVASATPQNFDEDSAAGTTVATISYTDTDNENTTAGSTPTLNNVPQHGGADMFTISGNNIVLTEAGVAFYQTNEPGDEATSMTVTFTDAAGNTSDPVAVAINAQDIDEVAPVASVTPQNFDEDSAAGTTVATISYTDTDNENTTAGSTPTLNNVPQHGGADMFTISGNNIVLTDAGVAFYQTNEPGDEATGMTVTFTDAAGNTSDPVAVAINAQDIDEVAPVASVTPQNFDEDSAAGTTVATISYTDTDNENTAVGSTPTLNNVPQHGGADMFTISGNNIVLTEAGVAFYQTNEPGDEATGMTVTFTDAAGNTSDPVAVAINAQDIDEVAPVASVTPQNFDEDSAAGTTVATISYTDTDNENTTAGSTPTLNNVPQHGGADMFTISGNNIVLTDAGVAFYQTNEPGDEATGMTVTFTDAAGNTSDPVAVAINAQDIDEVAPVASVTPQNFDEDSAAGTTVATISYTDTDNENTAVGSTPTLNNVPQHGGADMFTISGNNIVLTEAGVAFYQTNEPGDEATGMTVTFTDAAGNTSDPVAVAINAQDIDEVAPVASVTPQNFDEDSAAGTTVATISYTDTDNENTAVGSTPTLNNVPQHGGADMFTISGNNIVLTEAGVAFYQTNEPGDEATSMTVTFTDAAGNTSDPVAVAINAQDIDEVAPVASVTPQNFDEDSAAGTTVATISYTDTDNENTAVGSTPTLNNVPQHGGADMFTISGNNIVLTDAGVAFYQTNEPGDEATGMTVTFTDAAGNTSDPVAVAINAQDIDEVAPVASVTPQNFDEDSAAGTTVATISYTDTDNENTAVGSTPTLNNVPQHGGADMFTISGNNIVLTDAGVAFYQTNEPGDEATGMTVTFTDAAGNTSDPVAVAINAQDIDEVAPVASVTPQNFDEDSAAGTTVATISYTDTDNENTTAGSTPTLNNVPQHGGADMFTISGNNIVLTDAGVAFYQTNEPGDEATGMTVTFTDAAGNTSDPVAVAINAQDIDEVAPVASVTPQNFDEDSAAGTTVATISYTDTDNENTAVGSTPTLNNVPQHGGADMFTISGNNIVLTDAGVAFYQTNEPGDEATGMTVTFTDAAGNTSDPVAVAINAQDIDEVAPVASVTPQNFDEDSAAGTTVATISYTDTDNENTTAGSTPTLNNVPQHGGADMFTISGNNIVLTDAGVAFYQTNEPGDEATGMTVTFTDAAGNTSDPVAVAINAQDIDEVAPVASATPQNFDEDSAAGTTVATISYTDTDNENTTAGSTPTLNNVPQHGGADMFTISGNNIVLTEAGVAFYQTNEPGDEATSMTVTFTDAAGNTSDPVAVAINAQDIDEVAPVASVTPQNFDEDSAAGTTVATISYTDTDNENTTAGSTPTLNNVPQHGGADMFTISGNNIVLTDAGVAFYQTNEPGDEATGMTVTFTDAAGNTSDPVAVAINAQDIDEVAPVASVTPQNFDEDSAAGTTVATISYTDTDNENTAVGSTPTLNNVPQAWRR